MVEEDRQKISFITKQGTYYYNVMPFELKNVGSMFQRIINKVFVEQIGYHIKVPMLMT